MRVRFAAAVLLVLCLVPQVFAAPAQVTVRKTVLRELKVLPGYSESTVVSVTLVFDAPYSGSVVDYLAFATGEEFTATAPPSRVSRDGEFLACFWDNVSVAAGDSLKYSTNGVNLFHVELYLSADNRSLSLDCSRGYCYAVALKARVINYTIIVKAADELLRRQQIPISVSWSVDPLQLYPVGYSESPQSLRESGTEVSFQWTSFMNGSYRLSVLFEVRGENPWGEVLVPAPVVTVSLDPRLQASLMERYRDFTLKYLEEKVGNLSAFKENVTALRDLLYNLSAGFDEEAAMLDRAAATASAASDAMDNAARQLLKGLDEMNNIEQSLRPVLRNVSKLLDAAKLEVENARSNLTLLRERLNEVAASLNVTAANFSTSDIENILDEARARLSKLQSTVYEVNNLLGMYQSMKNQLASGVENMQAASSQLRLMSNILREAAYKLRELSGGLRRAADLIDATLVKVSSLFEAPTYPQSFLEFNETILSQRTTSANGSAALQSNLMGDAVYISLPVVKVKRSEPQTSGLKLEPPTKKTVQMYWPAIVGVLLIGAYLGLANRHSANSAPQEEVLRRIESLKDRVKRLEAM